jgi:hypothetical protein
LFGVVLAAWDSEGNPVCVVKVFQDPNMKNRELGILLELDRPNCLKVLDHFALREGTGMYL